MIKSPEKQQIFLSGLGGQGILFITRLLAETAIYTGYRILSAETHGMAQRGGVVVSHLKAGDFSSPLIRPGMADILILLYRGNLGQHGRFLRPGGSAIINSSTAMDGPESLWMDASAAAREIGQPRSMNLVLAGFAVSALNIKGRPMFCSADDIRTVLDRKLSGRGKQLEGALVAFNYGVLYGERNTNE
jgi:indolepyruvate ferredoxin oxidoreductase, beta subunit